MNDNSWDYETMWSYYNILSMLYYYKYDILYGYVIISWVYSKFMSI
jgi:hypothetical protein